MREVKRNNPGAAVRLDYDRVEVGDRSYVFSHEEGRVVERERGQVLGSQVSWAGERRVEYTVNCLQGNLFNTFGSLNKLQELDNIEEEDNVALLEKREMIRVLEEEMNNKDKEMERLKQMLEDIKNIGD